jgi:two-component system, NarL family, response regulator DevR
VRRREVFYVLVLVVDQPIVQYALHTLLQSSGAYVVGASTKRQAIVELRSAHPPLVIIDPCLNDAHGWLDLCRFARSVQEPPRFMVYSADDSLEMRQAALSVGAHSFVHKSIVCSELRHIIRRILRGERVWMGSDHGVRAREESWNAAELVAPVAMSRREREILGLVLMRMSNEEIAEKLVLARQTVKNHVSRIFQKVGVRSRRELLRKLGENPAPERCAPQRGLVGRALRSAPPSWHVRARRRPSTRPTSII